MHSFELLVKKREGGVFSRKEWDFLIQQYLEGSFPDYQMAALLMIIYFRGLETQEIVDLTQVMIHSGEVCEFPQQYSLVDKHSTGGVGDKTSLIIAPLVASCGVKVPMIAGRGLGHTGGTLDKLDAIFGYKTMLSMEQFRQLVLQSGYAIAGQTATLAPADRMLYSLRDVTATVESFGLIIASILSKKIVEGTDGLVLDVKVGSGAFIKDEVQAQKLAKGLVEVAHKLGKKAVALLSDMSQPLGTMVGNFLEVEEAVECLEGQGPEDLVNLSVALASHMLLLAETVPSLEEGVVLCHKKLQSGEALQKFYENVEQQGGDVRRLKADLGQRRSAHKKVLLASKEGFISHMDTHEIGQLGILLKVGRQHKEDKLDYEAGMHFAKKIGDFVKKGQELCTIYAPSSDVLGEVTTRLSAAYGFTQEPVTPPDLIKEIITQ